MPDGTVGSATPRPIFTSDPDVEFRRWHVIEFGFEPGKYSTPVESLRSCWEHARRFEQRLIGERNIAAIRKAQEEIERGREDTGRSD